MGCRSTHTNDYGAAAAGLGVAVATTAVYRAATGDCWARCPAGHICDRASGLCVAAECAPGCPVGQHCVREVDGSTRCVDSAGTFTFGASAPDGGLAAASGGEAGAIASGEADSAARAGLGAADAGAERADSGLQPVDGEPTGQDAAAE
jgi:hypothetical protein